VAGQQAPISQSTAPHAAITETEQDSAAILGGVTQPVMKSSVITSCSPLEINRHFASIFMVRAKTLLVTCFHLGFY
jgi:hypothetical protein